MQGTVGSLLQLPDHKDVHISDADGGDGRTDRMYRCERPLKNTAESGRGQSYRLAYGGVPALMDRDMGGAIRD
jgi:hypothetical protein